MQRALDFRTALLQSGGCAFTAEVTADYGEQVYRFTMDCTWSPDGGAALTLTAPQTLEGIRAEVSADGARVVYEDTAVGFESLAGALRRWRCRIFWAAAGTRAIFPPAEWRTACSG